MAGPLTGTRIIEVAGIGPGPFAAMMLADMGAEVIRVERTQAVRDEATRRRATDVLQRGRRNLAIDLKHPDGVATFLRLVEQADALIEGFRPGVMERLGVGPEACLERNPKIVFGRMTGWGQEGPYSTHAGHDINYISLAGALAHFTRHGERPVPPLNLVGDFGGGGMFLAFGVVCGMLEASRSGQGQIVDAAMVDGAAVLMTMFWAMKEGGIFDVSRPGTNMLDTGAHYYDVYRCADGRHISVGPIEAQFYAELLRLIGLGDDAEFAIQNDRALWPVLKGRLEQLFHTKSRDEWCDILEYTDACFAPVLDMTEAAAHPHNLARGTFVEVDGVTQPAPAPRFSRSGTRPPTSPAHAGQHTRGVLADWGLDEKEIEALVASGAVK
jgi:alpha-methylacyl-CoA racemase